jgi:Methyltransferase FkbM domain
MGSQIWLVVLLVVVALAVVRQCYVRFVVRPGTLRNRTLPNGMKIVGTSGDMFESFVFHENFVERTYLKGGITVGPTSVVLDIGANIGLFTLSLLEQFPGIKIHCIEPVPALFNALTQNTAAASKVKGDVVCHNVALADREGTATFTYNPQASATSGMFKGSTVFVPRQLGLSSWVAALLDDGVIGGVLPKSFAVFPPLFRKPVVGTLLALALAPVWLVAGIFHLAGQVPSVKFETKTTTLDRILKDHQLEKLDLVKLDVEGAELMVLQSISDDAFSRIQQIVIEVHDIENRTQVVTEMLQKRGFEVKQGQDERLATQSLLRIDTLYAQRRAS